MVVPLSTSAQEITRTQFTGRDFDTFVSELSDFLRSRWGAAIFNNFQISGQGQMFIEREAYGLLSLAWYIDRNADDAFPDTVRLRRAAAALARARGIKPAGPVPPLVEISFTIDTPQILPVTIDKGTQLLGPSDLIFETLADVAFLAGETGPKTVNAQEGESVEEVFISDGLPAQSYELLRVPAGKRVAEGSIAVTVDAISWPTVDFIDFGQTDQVETDVFSDIAQILFGNGIAGNIPPEGAEIRVTYLATSGTAGAVQGGTVTELVDAVVVALTTIPVSLTNPDPSTPGSDGDTIAKIKALIPQIFAAAGRAVTVEDYDALINSFVDATYGAVAIGKSNIVRTLEEDAEIITILQLLENQSVTQDVLDRIRTHWETVVSSNCKANLVSVQALERDGLGILVAPSVGLLVALRGYLNTFKESTVSIAVSDGSINLFAVDVTVEWSPTGLDINVSQVGQAVEDAVEDFLKSRTYGQSIRRSDLFSIVEDIEGVEFSNITITEPSALLDGNGNVVLQDYQIVTLGTVTVQVI